MIIAMATILLALGSNLGDRAANLARARALLAQTITLLAVSPIYETAPWGITDQPYFLNQALMADTELPPSDLLQLIKKIEAHMGRDFSTERYGPRIIDIDIIAYDNISLHNPNLTIPHPRLPERAFVLMPLKDIVPAWLHPDLHLTTTEMLGRIDTTGVELWQPEHKLKSG